MIPKCDWVFLLMLFGVCLAGVSAGQLYVGPYLLKVIQKSSWCSGKTK